MQSIRIFKKSSGIHNNTATFVITLQGLTNLTLNQDSCLYEKVNTTLPLWHILPVVGHFTAEILNIISSSNSQQCSHTALRSMVQTLSTSTLAGSQRLTELKMMICLATKLLTVYDVCVIAMADCPEKHKVLPLCEGDAQEASMLSRLKGGGGDGWVGGVGSSHCLCSGQKPIACGC